MKDALITAMYEFAVRAGRYAREEQPKMRAHLKADDSYVTNVDLHLSEMALEILSRVIPPQHVVTEEHLGLFDDLVRSKRTEIPEYVVMVDPIDGTRNFVHQMPLYGVSIGVLRNFRPWLGLVAFPAMDELFICDGESARVERGFLTGNSHVAVLDREPPHLDRNSIVLASHSFNKRYRWNHAVSQLSVFGCATIDLCWPSARRAAGATFHAGIWDLAGSWPIVEATGLGLFRLNDFSRVERFDWDDFDPVTMKLKDPVLVCHPDHVQRLFRGIIGYGVT